MPYAQEFVQVVMSGTTYPGEFFSTGLSMIGAAPGNTAAQPNDLAPFVAACSAWFRSTDTRISNIARLRTVKVNRIGIDGKYVDKTNTRLVDIAAPVAGGSPQTSVAAQLTMAITLGSASLRGPASKGRMYPPLTAVTIEPDGLVTGATCAAMANSALTLINALNAIPGAGLRVGLVSDRLEGFQAPVTRVEVGRVVDTQRRRRRGLVDTRVPGTTALVP